MAESPPPEAQTGSQVNAPPAKADVLESSQDTKNINEEFLASAESNPEHIMHEHADNKTSKKLGNITLKSDGDIVK